MRCATMAHVVTNTPNPLEPRAGTGTGGTKTRATVQEATTKCASHRGVETGGIAPSSGDRGAQWSQEETQLP